ncbi:MAG: peptidylprolyl isomerase [Elusimicrobia bacterium]|nr:peptidylprolyl isomerase [Elusimicrobiota bacterium]
MIISRFNTRRFIFLFFFLTWNLEQGTASLWAAKLPDGLYVRLETTKGDIVCRLFTGQAPVAARNFGSLVSGVTSWVDPKTGKRVYQKKFYDGLVFYRVEKDAVIEGGDPLGDGTGGPGFEFEDEIVPELTFNESGRLALANSGPGTNGSRFFITLEPMPQLNGKYTIFGEVVKGLKVVRKISRIDADDKGRPRKAATIKKAVIFRVPELP